MTILAWVPSATGGRRRGGSLHGLRALGACVLWSCAACGGSESSGDADPAAGSLPAVATPADTVDDTLDGAAMEAAATDEAEAADSLDAAGIQERGAEPPPPPEVFDEPPTFERPEHVRGLYLNAWTSGSTARADQLIELARRTEVNAFVIDIKDASGFVSHPTSVELAREIGATEEVRIRSLSRLLHRLSQAGIYPIARIVIVKDPILTEARPDLAVQDTAGGIWIDGKGIRWLNPFAEEVWDYHVALAREVADAGFPEIQWDYVRFPDAPQSELERAHFPGREGDTKASAIRRFLEYAGERLADVEMTADVFGVTTTAGDVGIGQVWEEFIDVVDVALPMVYPSHYWEGSYGIQEPNAFPYEVVRRALEDALARSGRVEGAGTTRPWLQAFSLGEPPYGAPEIRAQMQAGYDVGVEEWILWNPGSRYLEEALAPAAGFSEEPLIRVGGEIVPLSERHEAIARYRAAADTGRAVPPVEVVDTLGVDTLVVDTLSVDTLAVHVPGADPPVLDAVGSAVIRRGGNTPRP